MTPGTKARWPLLVGGVAVLVCIDTLSNGFALDDVGLVERNPALASLAHLPRLFLQPYWAVSGEHYGLYRPLTAASFAVNRALTGPGPWGFHAINILLHALVAMLAWSALRRAGTHYGTALTGGLLFAVHPIHTEAVANIAGRAELLAGAFALAAWIVHARAREASGGRVPGTWGAAALYFAAILSKEGAILAPVLFAADDAIRAGRLRLARYLPYLAAGAAFAALRFAALGAQQSAASAIARDNPLLSAGPGVRVLTALFVQARYLMLCVWPALLVSDYGYDSVPVVSGLADPRAAVGLAAAALVVAGLVWGWRRSRPVAIAALVWVLFSLPSANLLFPAGALMAERLVYLPSLGFCLLAGHVAAACAARDGAASAKRVRAIGVGTVAVVVLAALSARTWVRNPAWKDNLTLATTDVVSQPRSAKLQAGAGIALAAAGRNPEAEAHFRSALAIDSGDAQSWYNLAVVLLRRGAAAEAADDLRRANELAPDNPRPRELLRKLQGTNP
jgi:protein O-mannosyl-transferase